METLREAIDNQKNIVKNYEKELLLYNNKVEILTSEAIKALEEKVKFYKNEIATTSERYQVAIDKLLGLEEEMNSNKPISEGGC